MKTPLIISDDIRSRNMEINGGMNFWQRGQTFAPIANNTYACDRYRYLQTGSMAFTASRSTDVPADSTCIYSTRLECTTAQAVLGAGDRSVFTHVIEGNFARQLRAGRTFTRTFAVKSNKPGTYAVSVVNAGYDHSVVATFVIAQAGVWERKTIVFPALPWTVGTWDFNTGAGILLAFTLCAGTTWSTATIGTWQAAFYQGATGQANLADTVGNYMLITECQTFDGNEARPFDFAGRNYADELALCQRYFEKQWELDTVPGTATSATLLARPSPNNTLYGQERFRQIKRANPTPLVYPFNGGAGGSSATAQFSAPGYNSGSNPLVISSTTSEYFNFYCAAGYQEYWKYVSFGWTADADFYT